MSTPKTTWARDVDDLMGKFEEMQSEWHTQEKASMAVRAQTQHLQSIIEEHALYSARWKWVPPPYYTHWTAKQRAHFLDVPRNRAAGGVAAPLCRTAVIENRCVEQDIDPSYPRFCVVVWPCTSELNVPHLIRALQSLREPKQRKDATTENFDLCWALPSDATHITHSLTAQVACPLLPSVSNHGTPIILARSAAALRFVWIDTGHWHTKLGLTVRDFCRVVQPVVADISTSSAKLRQPDVDGTQLDVMASTLKRTDAADVEAMRLQSLLQTLPDAQDTSFRSARHRTDLSALRRTTESAMRRRQAKLQKEEEEQKAVALQRKPPLPRALSSQSRLLQPTESSRRHATEEESPKVVSKSPRKPALPEQARGKPTSQSRLLQPTESSRRHTTEEESPKVVSKSPRKPALPKQARGKPASTTSKQTSIPVPRVNETKTATPPVTKTTRRTTTRRGTSTPSSSRPASGTKPKVVTPNNVDWNQSNADEELEEADDIIGSVENDEDFFMMTDDMMLDDLLSDDGIDVALESPMIANVNSQSATATTTNTNATPVTPSPLKEMQRHVVSELYRKLTTIPVPSHMEMQALFERIDKANVGQLKLKNIETAIIQRHWDLPPTIILRAFEKADSHSHGTISKEEFFHFMRCIVYFENLMNLFVEMDTDSDRRLSLEEFAKGADLLEITSPTEVFAQITGGKAEYIVFDEFCLWMDQYRTLQDVESGNLHDGSPKTDSDAGKSAQKDAEKVGVEDEETPVVEKVDEEERIQLEKSRLAEEERIAREKALAEEQERLEKEREMERERIARQQEEEEARRLEEERIAQEKAEAEARLLEDEKAAHKKAEAEAEAQRLEEERVAREKAETEAELRRLEEEKAAREKAEAEAEARRLEEEKVAREKAEAAAEARRLEEEKIAREKAQAEEAEQARLEAEAEAKRVELERLALEQAEAERLAKEELEQAEAERLAKEKAAEKERLREQEEKRIEEEKIAEEERLREQEEKRIREEKAAEEERLQEEAGVPSQQSPGTEQGEESKGVDTAEGESVDPNHEVGTSKDDSQSAANDRLAEGNLSDESAEASTETVADILQDIVTDVEDTLTKEKPVDTTIDTEVSVLSVDGIHPDFVDDKEAINKTTATESEAVASANTASVVETTPKLGETEPEDQQKLDEIMERRRKLAEQEEEGSSVPALEEGVSKVSEASQPFLDAEVKAKLDRRRALSDEGVILTSSVERRGGSTKAAISDEVQAKLDYRRSLSDEGLDRMEDMERRATTKRNFLKSFAMSTDLQAIMARRRQAADAGGEEAAPVESQEGDTPSPDSGTDNGKGLGTSFWKNQASQLRSQAKKVAGNASTFFNKMNAPVPSTTTPETGTDPEASASDTPLKDDSSTNPEPKVSPLADDDESGAVEEDPPPAPAAPEEEKQVSN